MSQTPFLCPNCGTPIADAMSSQLRTQIQQELKTQYEKDAEQLAKEKAQLKTLQQNLAEQQKEVEQKIAAEVAKEKGKLWEKAKQEAQARISEESGKKLAELEAENKRKTELLHKAEEQELQLRKQAREIEERAQRLELEVQRKLDAERKVIADKAKQDVYEENRLKMLEKEKQLEMMRQQIEDLKRKSEQGSMQIQGEVQEEDLKALLQRMFPTDVIEDVEKGIRGADLVQKVRNQFGEIVGVILWESKNTKAWSEGWVQKLKDDQGRIKVDLCVLVSQALPDGMKQFGSVDGIWVTCPASVVELTRALRFQLTQLFQLRRSLVGREEKMEVLYSYLSGAQFRQRVENIVTAFTNLRVDLDKEKRAFERMWRKREQELERVMSNTSGMYGDLQGIIGAALPTVSSLELGDGLEESEDENVQPVLFSE